MLAALTCAHPGELPQEEPESVDVEAELQSLLDADIDIGEFFGDEVNKASLSDIVQSLKTDFVADLVMFLSCLHATDAHLHFRSHQTKLVLQRLQQICGTKFAFIS